jgi:hypothetical protein
MAVVSGAWEKVRLFCLGGQLAYKCGMLTLFAFMLCSVSQMPGDALSVQHTVAVVTEESGCCILVVWLAAGLVAGGRLVARGRMAAGNLISGHYLL